MEHVIHHRLEEGAVVAHHQHRCLELAEVVFQPAGGLEIEVIGGLVQQEEIGRGHQLAHQPQAAPLAAAQALEPAAPRLVGVEPEPMQHRVDPGCDAVAVLPLKALEIPVVATEHRLGHLVAGLSQRDRLLRQRALQVQQRAERSCGRFPHAGGAGEVALLVHQG